MPTSYCVSPSVSLFTAFSLAISKITSLTASLPVILSLSTPTSLLLELIYDSSSLSVGSSLSLSIPELSSSGSPTALANLCLLITSSSVNTTADSGSDGSAPPRVCMRKARRMALASCWLFIFLLFANARVLTALAWCAVRNKKTVAPLRNMKYRLLWSSIIVCDVRCVSRSSVPILLMYSYFSLQIKHLPRTPIVPPLRMLVACMANKLGSRTSRGGLIYEEEEESP